ncbi:MAG TPA: M1 family aminopeptidase [Gemmatimonadaceae bacterium]|nr:M1 family aminopeptidase [Gemmatimonadaceae bacterium]
MTFLYLLRWELRQYLTRVSTWIYFGILAAIACLMLLVTAGAFSSAAVVLGAGGKVLANSPYSLTSLMPVIALLGLSIVAAVAGSALYRDYEARMDPLVYTTPVSKLAFLGGRFAGTLIVNAVILLGVAAGALLATQMPGVPPDKLAPFDAWAYLQPYLTLILPNLFFTAAIFFALPALTRQMLPNYAGGVLLLIGYLVAGQYLQDLADKRLAALIDPFGLRAVAITTQYWSIAEKNARFVPFSGVFAENRAIWTAVGAAIFALALWKFRFAHASSAARFRTSPAAPAAPVAAPLHLVALPHATRSFGRRARLAQYGAVTARSFWRIVRNRYFYAIVGGGVLYLAVAAQQVGKLYGTTTWPVTYEMEEILDGSFGIFMLVVIAFYAGELVWAERDAKIDQMTDAAPTPDAVSYLGKLTALVAVIALLLCVIMLMGVGAQALKGYYLFEIPLYLQALFGMRFVDLILLAVLATTVHVLVNHKYVGHLLVFVAFLGNELLPQFGLEQNLYRFASDGGSRYSDMNGWGPFVRPFVYWKLYWLAFAVLLGVLTAVFWIRGSETHLHWRTLLARRRFGRRARIVTAAAAAAFLGLGGFLFYNTNVLNAYVTRRDARHRRAELERRYKRYENAPQPRITAVQVQVDLRPRAQAMRVRGRYVLRNETGVAIDTLQLRIPREVEIRALALDRPSRLVLADSLHAFYMHRLRSPLAPGDSVVLRFDLARVTRGFANRVDNTEVVANGTFVENAAFMPGIGYTARAELTDDDDRRKEGLAPRPRMRPPTDPRTRDHNYVTGDADWLRYDAVVSTDTDQTALTSGTLVKEWVQDGRRYFHYTMDAPILDLWAFQSARYAVRRDRWPAPDGRTIGIAVYYHPAHAYNVARMIDAVKKSLAYYTANFGPYQHRQLDIVEFPRYAAFAQSLPNTIPFSEAIGFIARVESPTDVDFPFYVTAHEVAHQWWAHQVIGADAQGSTMLSETLAQYSALMVMKHEFGAENMRRFLEYELDHYLIGRSTERKREMPLELAEDQPYIHYNKGSLATYALQDYIGESRMNRALRGFLEATQFRGPPYPTSLQLVDSLRAATPDSLRYLITDLFETITLYELRADSARGTPVPGNRYRVELYVTAKKLRADSLGKETEVPMSDWIDVGVYTRPVPGEVSPDRDGVPVYLEKHRIHQGAQIISITVAARPSRAGIDPLHELIDRKTTDNTIGVQGLSVQRRTVPRARRP